MRKMLMAALLGAGVATTSAMADDAISLKVIGQPLATGERVHSVPEFRELFERGVDAPGEPGARLGARGREVPRRPRRTW